MAAMITRKAVFSSSSRLMHKLLSPARPLAATSPMSRSLYTNIRQVRCRSDDEEEDDRMTLSKKYMDGWTVGRRSLFHHPLDHPEPLRRKMMDKPLLLAKSPGRRDELKGGCDIREDEDCVHLRMEMPGLGKEDVKVSVDRDGHMIIGFGSQGKKKPEDDDESGRSYTNQIGFGLPPALYKLDQIRGEMKNGVLRLSVPKVKEEEKTKDVFEVKIE